MSTTLNITPARLALLREIGAGHVSMSMYRTKVIHCQADCPHRRGRQTLVSRRVDELVRARLAQWARSPAVVGDCVGLTYAGRKALAERTELTP